MRALIFVLLIVLALPLLICGFLIYTWRVRRIVIPQNISGTAEAARCHRHRLDFRYWNMKRKYENLLSKAGLEHPMWYDLELILFSKYS